MNPILTKKAQNQLQELRDSGVFCCININSNYNFVWYVTLKKANDDTPHNVPTYRSGACIALSEAVNYVYEMAKKDLE